MILSKQVYTVITVDAKELKPIFSKYKATDSYRKLMNLYEEASVYFTKLANNKHPNKKGNLFASINDISFSASENCIAAKIREVEEYDR